MDMLAKLIADGQDLLRNRIASGHRFLKDSVDRVAYSRWAMSCIAFLEEIAPIHARQIRVIYNPQLNFVDSAENIFGILLSATEIVLFKQRSASVNNGLASNSDVSKESDKLHPRLKAKCLDHLIAGKYDDAILNAGIVIEVHTRTLANLEDTDFGVNLMRTAFKPDAPKLKYSDVKSEQQAVMELFSGFIGVFKNPQSHRHVGISDYQIAVEVVSFANLLCRILDGFRR